MYQKYIAELLGVEPGTVSKYESNQLEPKIETLKKWFAARIEFLDSQWQ